jgi:hypothetical protein
MVRPTHFNPSLEHPQSFKLSNKSLNMFSKPSVIVTSVLIVSFISSGGAKPV